MDKITKLITAYRAHELGLELNMTNSEYDKLLEEVLSENPGFCIYDYHPIPEGAQSIEHRSGMITLEKWSPEDNDIRQYWNKEYGKVKMPKYDGSSGVAYYTNGKLESVASMGDKSEGINQTDKLGKYLPEFVDSSISFIRFELLVDSRIHDNARGKANGLMNSKYLENEIKEYASMIGFQVIDLLGKSIPWDDERVRNIPNLIRDNGVPYFMISPEVQDIELLEERGYARIHNDLIDFQFCIDGIVYHTDPSYADNWAYKYDYLTTAETTVIDIKWNETSSEGYTPVLKIDPVNLDNKWMYKLSTNGVPRLLSLGCGINSTINVAFSKMTIPQVVSVVEESNIEFPKCHCGHQFTTDDISGQLLKCYDQKCSRKLELRQKWMNNSLLEIEDKEAYVDEHLEWYLMTYLNIQRFDYSSKRYVEFESIKNNIKSLIIDMKTDELRDLLYNSYRMSDSQYYDMERSLYATMLVLKDYIK